MRETQTAIVPQNPLIQLTMEKEIKVMYATEENAYEGETLYSFDTFDEAYEYMVREVADSVECSEEEVKEMVGENNYIETINANGYNVLFLITNDTKVGEKIFGDMRDEFIAQVEDERNEFWEEE